MLRERVTSTLAVHAEADARVELSRVLFVISQLRTMRQQCPEMRTLENTLQVAKSVQKLAIKLLTGPLLPE